MFVRMALTSSSLSADFGFAGAHEAKKTKHVRAITDR
jgi:hypothetical protein